MPAKEPKPELTEEQKSQVAALMGSIRTEKKSATSRQNVAGARAVRAANLVLAACNCGATDDQHTYPCPVYMRQATTKSRERAKLKAQQEASSKT